MERQRDKRGRFQKGNTEGRKFKAGDIGNPAGRPPLLCNALKNIPQDAREKVHDALWTAISQPDVKSAQVYLQKAAEDMPECGFVLQLAVKTLMGNKGWFALMDICDRLFGKPRQITEVEGNFNIAPPPIIIEGEDE
jgi:hypothetical protein